MKFTQTTLLGLALLVFGLVLCGAGAFLLSRPAQYRATARIIIMIKNEIITTNSFDDGYDPGFVPTDFELLRSMTVLSNVVAGLNLEEVCGNKFAGRRKLPWY